MKRFLFFPLLALAVIGHGQTNPGIPVKKKAIPATCNDGCANKPITCKLTSTQMQERKATVLASLKKLIIGKMELKNGFSYKFPGTDAVVDELISFVKTERLCCDFFDFSVAVKGDGSSVWLTITGPRGAKAFIISEMAL